MGWVGLNLLYDEAVSYGIVDKIWYIYNTYPFKPWNNVKLYDGDVLYGMLVGWYSFVIDSVDLYLIGFVRN